MNNYLELATGQTTRLDIKPMEYKDFEKWIPFFADENCRKFYKIIDQPHHHSAQQWVASHITASLQGKYGQLSLYKKDTDTLIGSCGFVKQNLNGQIITELGYAILPQYQNQGFATEAAKYFVELYEKNIRQNNERLHALIRTDNEPSREVAEKIGMTLSHITQWLGMTMYVYMYLDNYKIKTYVLPDPNAEENAKQQMTKIDKGLFFVKPIHTEIVYPDPSEPNNNENNGKITYMSEIWG